MMFYIATPKGYTTNVVFYWKLIFLLIAAADLLYLTVWPRRGNGCGHADACSRARHRRCRAGQLRRRHVLRSHAAVPRESF
jgi:hypothetical protein